MRILHVIRTLDPAWGGPVEGVRNITTQAMLRGHEPQIVTLDHPSRPWLRSWSPQVHAIGQSTSKLSTYGLAPALDRWLTENLSRFDRVVVHSIWMYFSYAVWKATRKTSVPYYLFIHGALDPWFKKAYPLKHVKKTLYWKLIEHRVLRDAQAVLFTTQEEMLKARDAFSPYNCRPSVIGYGISPPAVDERMAREMLIGEVTQSIPQLRHRNFLLLLARIHQKKGIEMLLQAFAAMRGAFENHALVVVGSGNAKYVHNLQKLASALKIQDQVVWTGPLYGEAKFNVLRAADAYVLPSHQENFGISVVEALACGTPVLISDKVNIWREVTDSGAGFVEPDTIEGTTSLLRRWSLLAPAYRTEIRTRAKACFAANFDMSVACERLFEVLLSRDAPQLAAVRDSF